MVCDPGPGRDAGMYQIHEEHLAGAPETEPEDTAIATKPFIAQALLAEQETFT